MQKGKKVKLVNFIVWLAAGAVIGWVASRMVQLERTEAASISS